MCPTGYQVDGISNTTCILTPVVIPNPIPGTGTVVYAAAADNKTYVYFPVLSTQTVFSGVSAGAALIGGGGSMVLTSMVSMWGPLEFFAYGG